MARARVDDNIPIHQQLSRILHAVRRATGCQIDCYQVTARNGWAQVVVLDEDFTVTVPASSIGAHVAVETFPRARFVGACTHEGGTVTLDFHPIEGGGYDIRVGVDP